MRRAVLFDLDDTLTDRRASIARYARRLHTDFSDGLASVTVNETVAVINAADRGGYAPKDHVFFSTLLRELPWHNAPHVDELNAHWREAFPSETAARPGVRETLEALRAGGFDLGIVTNGREKVQQATIDSLGIRPFFASVVISEVVGFKKPDVRIFETALGEIGAASSDAWFVGDHPHNDVLGAASAGLRAVWLTGAHAWAVGHTLPRYRISNLPDLVELVRGDHDPALVARSIPVR